MADFPLVNGNRFSWASIVLNANGTEITGITEISYSHKLEPGTVRGAGPWKAGRTRGEYTAEGSLTLLRSDWDAFRDSLGDGFLEIDFTTSVSYSEVAEGPVVTDELVGCRIKGPEHSPSQGTDPTTVQLPLDILYILENGKLPLKNMRL